MIVCVLDDVSWPDLAAAETPAIDSLRERGISFEGFHTMPVCSATRLALWTGRLPRRMGVGEGINHFVPPGPENPSPAADLETLPRVLSAVGYETCLIGKWHAGAFADDGVAVAERSALEIGGFDHWLAGTPANLRSKRGRGYGSWYRIDQGVGRMEEAYPTAVQVEAAKKWWKETPSTKLMVVSLNTPHAPYHKPPEEWRRTDHAPERSGRFLEMVEAGDLVVEELLKLMDANTWFFLISDNGTPPAINGATQRGKSSTYDRGVRVPMIVVGPKIAPQARGKSTKALISCTDVYATLAEIAGAEPSWKCGGEDSVSFAAAFVEGEEYEGREFVFSEKFETNSKNKGSGDDVMVRDERWKLRRVDGEEWLYDLTTKPLERNPLSPAGLEGEARQAYARLSAFLAEIPSRMPPATGN